MLTLIFGLLAGLPLAMLLFTGVVGAISGWKWIGIGSMLYHLAVSRQGWGPGEGPGTERFENDHGLPISLATDSPLGQFIAKLSQY
jgi:hypothetical protein